METLKLKKITALWIIVIMVLFVVAIVLGILMRLNQGGVITQSPITFYTNMTTHGLTMIGIWFVAGMAAIHYIAQRYVNVNSWSNKFAFALTVIGILMLWTSTFIGKFNAGWTFLYPLPLKIMWAKWATPLFLWSLVVLVVGWLVWTIDMMVQILKKYTLAQSFAWQYFSRKNPEVQTPPFILISMISLTGILTCLIAGATVVALFFAEYYSNGDFVNDALLMKNFIYYFGHTLANEMLYLGLAVLYELFPEVGGRPKWKTTWYVAIAWNLTLIFILTAFLHHLYMDFVQPEGLQIIGQLASYLASLPAAAITIFSVIIAVYKTNLRWNLVNLLFFFGVIGWAIGGLGAVIDATISNNFVLHNTLWVPAHFHTYNAMGNVLFSLAFFQWFSMQYAGEQAKEKMLYLKAAFLLIGGIGFLFAFYTGGAQGVPRRFSNYPAELADAPMLAFWGALFAIAYLVAILLFLTDIGKRCISVLLARSS